MLKKQLLHQVHRVIPDSLLIKLQELHARMLLSWLRRGSQPLTVSQKSAMVFSPHQDDETFGCGGLIALKREQGVPVRVAFVTDGQNSHAGDPQVHPADLIETRKQEATTALGILGVAPAEIHFLEQLDGSLRHLSSEQRQRTVEQLAHLLRVYGPQEVYVPHHKDRHSDHEATYELVREAIAQSGVQVELLQYPIWMPWRSPLFISLKLQDIATAYRLPINSVQGKKRRAIEAYRSQLPLLPQGFLKHFCGSYEIFIKG